MTDEFFFIDLKENMINVFYCFNLGIIMFHDAL